MADENYLSPVQQQAQAVDALTKAQFEADQGARRNAAYNALGHIYGQEKVDALRGAPEAYNELSQNQLRESQGANMRSETASRDALLPGQVADQPVERALKKAQTSEADARTGYTAAQTADTTSKTTQRQDQSHDQNRALIATLIANSDDPGAALEKIAPVASHFGIADDEVDGVRQAIKADPKHAKAIADALMRKAYPQQFSTVGGVTFGQDSDGNAVGITHNKNGDISVKPLDGVTPTQVQTANTGTTRAQTGADAEAERERHNKEMEAAANQRIALAARNSAPLDDQTKGYLSDQVRLGRTDVLSRLNAAQRVTIYMDAAQKAAAEGKTGETDALNSQAFKARQQAFDDITKSTPNSMGGRIQSAGTLLDHLNTMTALITDLNSGNIQIKNAAQQRFKAEFGKSAPVTFDAQKTIVGDELARLLIANGGAAKDREKLIDQPLSRANSPSQLNSVADLLRGDIKARMLNARTLTAASKLDGEFDKRSSPSLKALLGVNVPATPPPAGGAPGPAKNDFSHLWSGR